LKNKIFPKGHKSDCNLILKKILFIKKINFDLWIVPLKYCRTKLVIKSNSRNLKLWWFLNCFLCGQLTLIDLTKAFLGFFCIFHHYKILRGKFSFCNDVNKKSVNSSLSEKNYIDKNLLLFFTIYQKLLIAVINWSITRYFGTKWKCIVDFLSQIFFSKNVIE